MAAGDREVERRAGAFVVEARGGLVRRARRDPVERISAAEDEPRGRGGEAGEAGLQLGARAPAGVVVELDVGDHRDLGMELEEARVGLVGLGDHPLPSAPPGVRRPAAGTRARELTADEEAWIRADGGEGVDDHAGRRRLPVRARDRDQPAQRAELGEQLTAVDHPLAALAGERKLGVVLGDRGRHDDLGIRRDVGGVVADPRLEARLPQPAQIGALGAVAAGDPGAELVSDEREPAHPSATDRDEVKRPPGPLGLSHRRLGSRRAPQPLPRRLHRGAPVRRLPSPSR